MALDDDAVITAAVGYIYTNTVGTVRPTLAEIDAFDPETFGAQTQKVVASAATTLTVGAQATASLPSTSTAAAVQTALESLTTVGVGNVLVVGSTDPDDTLADGLNVSWVGEKLGQTIALTGSSATVTVVTAANGWKMTGHTSRDDLPEFGKDGGDTEVKGTWQNKALRETLSGDPRVDFVTAILEQFDRGNLELYYGEDDTNEDGVFNVDGDFAPVERALLIVIVDGDVSVGFHAPKTSIRGDDSIAMDVDNFVGFPVRATFLKMGARKLFSWISDKLSNS
ncbi:phage tail protein [Mycobacteroides abscessus subsp. abscessus]|uniref:phage tail tube protein n=1 Tax=Mycobacteroides abscessus TaxID=36809 RepID=UPI00265ACF93|nr:phage tail protein [Mycobacteroides abscessus]MDO3076128.1 phage tail protein [Mycobacteroides abscessus subsp. abscessus]MDO3242597.1 phage tail protein [Mycobacteroides abscessus subsp. abscessus]WKE41469.1 phage tail protein [Mycobacteroides abscessus subsp. abscessus]